MSPGFAHGKITSGKLCALAAIRSALRLIEAGLAAPKS